MKPKLARKNQPAYFVEAAGSEAEEGPLALDDLREMAQAGTLAPDTRFRREDETELRPLSEDPPLMADLWPEEEAFDPVDLEEGAKADGADADEEEIDPDRGFASSDLLHQNLQRDRLARAAAGDEEPDQPRFLVRRGPLVRWTIALLLAGILAFMWIGPVGMNPANALVLGMAITIALISLVGYDIVQIAAAPITGLISTLIEGSGGGAQADYWTADSLMQQGEYRLALSEYRKITLQFPREVEAYLKGIRAAKALESQRDIDRFYEQAMKNLKSEQDRNLFANSVERM